MSQKRKGVHFKEYMLYTIKDTLCENHIFMILFCYICIKKRHKNKKERKFSLPNKLTEIDFFVWFVKLNRSNYLIHVSGTKAFFTNVEIVDCEEEGLYLGSHILLKMSDQCSVHNCNGVSGIGIYIGKHSIVQLVSPLTKDTVSTNNGMHGEQNWNGQGMVVIVNEWMRMRR